MSLAEDLRQLANLIDADPLAETVFNDRSLAGGHFVVGSDRYGDLCNALRKLGPVKVDVKRPTDKPPTFDVRVGGLLVTGMRFAPRFGS